MSVEYLDVVNLILVVKIVNLFVVVVNLFVVVVNLFVVVVVVEEMNQSQQFEQNQQRSIARREIVAV